MFRMIFNFLTRLINDILRDKGSTKYSVTKTIALSAFVLLSIIIFIGLYIMIKNQEIDHFLIGELIFFILTLLGFKNFRRIGYNNEKNEEKKEGEY
jgi:hypothetical protein